MNINRDTSVLSNYDILFVDAYGVFRDGKGVIPGSDKQFESLCNDGAIVFILSNTTQKSDDAEKGYAKKGLHKGVNYSEIITSGQIAYNLIQSDKIEFASKKDVKKVYHLGAPRKELFEGSSYEEAKSMEEADFMYISIPQLKTSETAGLSPEQRDKLYVSNLHKDAIMYDSLIIDPFIPMLEKAKALGLPAFSANPDKTALETPRAGTVKNVPAGDEEGNYVVRQGQIADAYKDMGMEVIETGKPHLSAYEYCFEVLKEKYGYTDESLKKAKIAMIGDTLETDILGASNASEKLGVKIDSVLTLTGVSAKDISMVDKFDNTKEAKLKNALDSIFEQKKIKPDVIIEAFVKSPAIDKVKRICKYKNKVKADHFARKAITKKLNGRT